MLRLMLRPLLMLITVLALCVGAVRVGYGLAYPMESAGVFAMSECELPCWMGLEVGVTDWVRIDEFMNSFEKIVSGRYTATFRTQDHITVNASGGQFLSGLYVTYDQCPIRLMMEIGLPDGIFYAIEGGVYYYLYLDEKVLVVTTSTESHSSAYIEFWDITEQDNTSNLMFVYQKTDYELSPLDWHLQSDIHNCET